MDRKLDVIEFREYKSKLQNLSRQYKMCIQSNEFSLADDAKREAISLQNELLSNDLSLVPFEEWDNITFYFDGDVLDFSKTHANLDFNILKIPLNNRKLNLEGCNVVNLDNLYLKNEEKIANRTYKAYRAYKEYPMNRQRSRIIYIIMKILLHQIWQILILLSF